MKAKSWLRHKTLNGARIIFQANAGEGGIVGQLTGQDLALPSGRPGEYGLTPKGIAWLGLDVVRVLTQGPSYWLTHIVNLWPPYME